MNSKIKVLTFLAAVSFLNYCEGTLYAYEEVALPEDITKYPKYGCYWEGGSTPGVICTCRDKEAEMYIRKNIPSFDTSKIHISGCRKVTFGTSAISDMRNLRSVILEDIENISFEPNGLEWKGYRDTNVYGANVPSVQVTIKNSNISRISSFAFSGRLKTIFLENIVINNTASFAFSNLKQTENIIIKNAKFIHFEPQAFRELYIENLEISGMISDALPSRAFSDITVDKSFILTNSEFTILRPQAFSIKNPIFVKISNLNINHLYGEAFRIETKGNVIFRHNIFYEVNDGAFSAITTEANSRNIIMTLENNTFSKLTRDSLKVSDINLRIYNLNVNDSCDCQYIDHIFKSSEFHTEIKCLYENSYTPVHSFKSEVCSVIVSNASIIIITGVVILLVVVIVTAVTIYYKKVYKTKTYGNKSHLNKMGNFSLIVPDGRTYRETELHVIVEKTNLLTTDL